MAISFVLYPLTSNVVIFLWWFSLSLLDDDFHTPPQDEACESCLARHRVQSDAHVARDEQLTFNIPLETR